MGPAPGPGPGVGGGGFGMMASGLPLHDNKSMQLNSIRKVMKVFLITVSSNVVTRNLVMERRGINRTKVIGKDRKRRGRGGMRAEGRREIQIVNGFAFFSAS